jgi:hypothetical protein
MADENKGTARNAFSFHTPAQGHSKTWGPVRILAGGDVVGNSPSYLCVDSEGVSRWLSMDDVRIIDPNYQPLNTRAFANLTAGVGSSR